MATAATPSPWKGHSHSHSHSHSNSRSTRSLTTPRSNLTITTPSSQLKSSLSPNIKSPQTAKDPRTTSPSYFGLVVEDSIPVDSGPGTHARQNWNDPSRASSRPTDNDRTADLELFRRQSEKSIPFILNTLPQTRTQSLDGPSPNRKLLSPVSPTNTSWHSAREEVKVNAAKDGPPDNPFFLGVQRQASPLSLSPQSIADARQARLSLPSHDIQSSIQSAMQALKAQRSDTVPPQPTKEVHAMVAPQEVTKIVEQFSDKAIILDLRVSPQFAASRVRGALNLCIPTTLLKRPAYTVQKLADAFTAEEDKAKFKRWKTAQYIVVYDAASSLPKEAITSFTVLKKFVTEGWKGSGFVVKGGFAGIQKLAPRLIEHGNKPSQTPRGAPAWPTSQTGEPRLPVAGGCQMPSPKHAVNPFFGNIRQNMDLLDGVGQMPIKKPAGITESEEKKFPMWLRRAASASNEGKDVSNKFLGIEKTEQKRMQKALSGTVSYGTPTQEKSNEVKIAGIEKGAKNRYNNIFPFEHSRVRLQGVPSHGCDYVNANFVKASYSSRKYIATQAPVPHTFGDFWRVVWEQDVRVIVMLTAESEGGQVKSHAYWKSGEYGSLKVKQLAEKRVSLLKSSQTKEATRRPTGTGRRLTISNATPAVERKFNFEPADIKASSKKVDEEPFATIRQFTISHSTQPFQPQREVIQIQYTQWPDFGAPASPKSILGLIELVNRYQPSDSSQPSTNAPSALVNGRKKPIIVHCSAGCGRTGTFCTIDSVIDMLKRQRLVSRRPNDAMDIDSIDDWVNRDDIDLVAKTVEDFRCQRLSMVQNLRQFVLCYESILQWLHDENSN